MAQVLEAPRIGRAAFSRKWDIMLIVGVALIVAAAFHISNMLTIGDWDFWTDWKDREFWATVTPVMSMVIPGALHYIGWKKLRIPIGATLGATLLVLASLLQTWVNFGGWDHFPMNFTWPATMVLGGVVLDCILLWTRGSFVLTSVIGGMLWGLVFQPQNWPMLVPFLQPVKFHGSLLSVSDVQGFMYLRAQTPEYLRIIEQGSLRAFLSQLTYITALFSGLLSIGTYWVGVCIGKFLAVDSATKYFGRRPAAPLPADEMIDMPSLAASEVGAVS